MIILGLGSNLGDRLLNLRRALALIKVHPEIRLEQVSPVYVSDALLPDNHPPREWNLPFLNAAIRCQTALAPLKLLRVVKEIEAQLGRNPNQLRWGPRLIDIDILAIDDLQLTCDELTIPHPDLNKRPWALWPLTDVAPLWQLDRIYPSLDEWGSRWSGNAPFHTKQIMQRIDTPQLMGIVNITPNSFSDGGKFNDPDQALIQIQHLIDSGAEIIDIGAEATSPRAPTLTADEEWARLEPLLSAVRQLLKTHFFIVPPKISVDTYHAQTAKKAIAAGVDWINDVTGLKDPEMRKVLADASHIDCVMMHHMSIPASREHILPRNCDPVAFIYEWAQKQLAILSSLGLKRERIIFDPGIGFGKVAEHSLALIKNANRFRELGVRTLYGHSRKLFLSLFTDRPFAERDLETKLISLYLAKQSVDYLRVHNVKDQAKAFRVAAAF